MRRVSCKTFGLCGCFCLGLLGVGTDCEASRYNPYGQHNQYGSSNLYDQSKRYTQSSLYGQSSTKSSLDSFKEKRKLADPKNKLAVTLTSAGTTSTNCLETPRDQTDKSRSTTPRPSTAGKKSGFGRSTTAASTIYSKIQTTRSSSRLENAGGQAGSQNTRPGSAANRHQNTILNKAKASGELDTSRSRPVSAHRSSSRLENAMVKTGTKITRPASAVGGRQNTILSRANASGGLDTGRNRPVSAPRSPIGGCTDRSLNETGFDNEIVSWIPGGSPKHEPTRDLRAEMQLGDTIRDELFSSPKKSTSPVQHNVWYNGPGSENGKGSYVHKPVKLENDAETVGGRSISRGRDRASSTKRPVSAQRTAIVRRDAGWRAGQGDTFVQPWRNLDASERNAWLQLAEAYKVPSQLLNVLASHKEEIERQNNEIEKQKEKVRRQNEEIEGLKETARRAAEEWDRKQKTDKEQKEKLQKQLDEFKRDLKKQEEEQRKRAEEEREAVRKRDEAAREREKAREKELEKQRNEEQAAMEKRLEEKLLKQEKERQKLSIDQSRVSSFKALSEGGTWKYRCDLGKLTIKSNVVNDGCPFGDCAIIIETTGHNVELKGQMNGWNLDFSSGVTVVLDQRATCKIGKAQSGTCPLSVRLNEKNCEPDLQYYVGPGKRAAKYCVYGKEVGSGYRFAMCWDNDYFFFGLIDQDTRKCEPKFGTLLRDGVCYTVQDGKETPYTPSSSADSAASSSSSSN